MKYTILHAFNEMQDPINTTNFITSHAYHCKDRYTRKQPFHHPRGRRWPTISHYG